jgi:hypothetical protein
MPLCNFPMVPSSLSLVMLTTYIFPPVMLRMPELTAGLSTPPTEHEPHVDLESLGPEDRPHDDESDAGTLTDHSNLGGDPDENPATS